MKDLRRRPWRAICGLIVPVSLGLATISCGLLDVNNPTVVEEKDLADAQGAQLLRAQVLRRFAEAVVFQTFEGGLFSDEFAYLSQGGLNNVTELSDQRAYEELTNTPSWATTNLGGYSFPQSLRTDASVALLKYREHTPPGALPRLGELYGLRGYAAIALGSTFCAGFPLRELNGFTPIHGPPLTIPQVFERALADFDSALVYAPDSARILNFVKLGRARALLEVGRFAEAAATVGDVPTNYKYHAEYRVGVVWNELALDYGWVGDGWSVADNEGTNGLPFVSANDPRVKTTPIIARNGTTQYGISKYPVTNSSITILSGIEARLIEAEAALRNNPGSSSWLTMLNALRTNGAQGSGGAYNAGTGGVPGLAPLADPGTTAGRVSLLYRERAFWLFATGTRLADLRRLVRIYGYDSESVFPTGAYVAGGMYGRGTAVPFPVGLEAPLNPAVTGCTDQ